MICCVVGGCRVRWLTSRWRLSARSRREELSRIRDDRLGSGRGEALLLSGLVVAGGGRLECAQPMPRRRQPAQFPDGPGRRAARPRFIAEHQGRAEDVAIDRDRAFFTCLGDRNISQPSHILVRRQRTQRSSLDVSVDLTCGDRLSRTGRTPRTRLRIRRLGVRIPPAAPRSKARSDYGTGLCLWSSTRYSRRRTGGRTWTTAPAVSSSGVWPRRSNPSRAHTRPGSPSTDRPLPARCLHCNAVAVPRSCS